MAEYLTQSAHCSTCGRPITPDDLAGLCISCVFGWATAASISDSPPLAPNSRPSLLNIAGYGVREEIGRGGMGIIYRTLQLEPRREVALKMLLPHLATSPGMLERFRLEAAAIATLEHPAILPVHHVGEHNGLPFFTMKLAAGGSLAERQKEFVGDWRRVAELVATLADAVQFAHERGVLHRDLKPGNVLFDEVGRPYVSDFGLAKLTDGENDLTRSVDLLGTPHYVAPEVAARSAKNATTASDVYSLGAILYELLSGHPPFQAEGVPALLKKIAEEEPRRIAIHHSPFTRRSVVGRVKAGSKSADSVPRDLEVICFKCLAKEPGRRYAAARALAEDLRRWLEGRTILARPATPIERARSWARRNPALAMMVTVLAFVLVVAVVWQARSNRRLQYTLAESLLRQAQLERSTGRAGQRFATLSLATDAATRFRASGSQISPVNKVWLRSEIAAALALPDLRPLNRWRVHIPSLDCELDFTADLERYAAFTPDGGFLVASVTDHRPAFRAVGITNNPATKLRLHPQGLWVAARFRDGHVELHAVVATNEPVRRWPAVPGAGALFEFDPAGDSCVVVASAPEGGRFAEVVDLKTGKTRTRIPVSGATALAFNSAGKILAISGTELGVWHVATTNLLWSAPLTHEAGAIAWSPDGTRLTVAMDRRRPIGRQPPLKASPVLIFDAANGDQKTSFSEFGSRIGRVAFHPDGERLAVATWESDLFWGELESREGVFIDGAHRALTFSPDGKRLGYAPTREELALLDVALPSALRPWQPRAHVAEEFFTMDGSKDDRWVVTVSSIGVHLWDAQLRAEIDSRPLPAKGAWVEVLFGGSNECVYVSAASFGVRRFGFTNGADGRLRFGDERTIGPPNSYLAVASHDNGRSLIVTENHPRMQRGAKGPTVWLWPDADPQRARRLAENFPLLGYRGIPNSRWGVTTALVAPDVWIWDFELGERVRNLGLEGRSSSVAAANGRWLVARTREEFGVWEVGTWKRVAHWLARPDEASMNLFSSPDGRLIATHNPGGRFVLRELPNGEEVILLTPPQPISVQHHQFSSDSTRLLFMGNNGQMFDWDLQGIRRELAKLELDWR